MTRSDAGMGADTSGRLVLGGSGLVLSRVAEEVLDGQGGIPLAEELDRGDRLVDAPPTLTKDFPAQRRLFDSESSREGLPGLVQSGKGEVNATYHRGNDSATVSRLSMRPRQSGGTVSGMERREALDALDRAIGRWIDRRKLAGLRASQAALAEVLGFNEPDLTRWKKGDRKIPHPKLIKLAQALEVSTDEILGLSEDEDQPLQHLPPPSIEIDSRDFVLIPKVAEQVAAGSPVLDLAAVEDRSWYAFRAGWVRHVGATADANRLCIVQVASDHKGESMIPTIQPGAMLVIDRGQGGRGIDSVDQGKIYLVRDPEESEGVMVKRVFYNRGQLVYWSDNFSFHPPITVPLSGRQLREVIVGKVILVQQKLDGDD